MPKFEPKPDVDMIEQYSEKQLRLQHEYTDDELLLELRRRGRFARVECDTIVPERYIVDGYPTETQIEGTWNRAAHEAAKLHIQGKRPTGAKIETVRGDGISLPPHERAQRVSFALNYVVEL